MENCSAVRDALKAEIEFHENEVAYLQECLASRVSPSSGSSGSLSDDVREEVLLSIEESGAVIRECKKALSSLDAISCESAIRSCRLMLSRFGAGSDSVFNLLENDGSTICAASVESLLASASDQLDKNRAKEFAHKALLRSYRIYRNLGKWRMKTAFKEAVYTLEYRREAARWMWASYRSGVPRASLTTRLHGWNQ